MCGRFTLRAPASAIAEQFGLLEVPPFAPLFNIAPTQPVAVVRQVSSGSSSSRELGWMHWGLIPSWAQDRTMGSRMINARADTVAQKPAYRAAFRRRRGLIVADGFYEWQRPEQTAGLGPGRLSGRGKGAAKKQPYFIHLRDDRPFALAGLWETWESPDGSPLDSSAIITTDANDLMQPIHDRMPVILSPQDYDRWLDPLAEQPDLLALLRPYPSEEMAAYPISAYVNSPTHDDPHCVEPLTANLFDF
jgi:putative SOS response-associated peptidase YedK